MLISPPLHIGPMLFESHQHPVAVCSKDFLVSVVRTWEHLYLMGCNHLLTYFSCLQSALYVTSFSLRCFGKAQ